MESFGFFCSLFWVISTKGIPTSQVWECEKTKNGPNRWLQGRLCSGFARPCVRPFVKNICMYPGGKGFASSDRESFLLLQRVCVCAATRTTTSIKQASGSSLSEFRIPGHRTRTVASLSRRLVAEAWYAECHHPRPVSPLPLPSASP